VRLSCLLLVLSLAAVGCRTSGRAMPDVAAVDVATAKDGRAPEDRVSVAGDAPASTDGYANNGPGSGDGARPRDVFTADVSGSDVSESSDATTEGPADAVGGSSDRPPFSPGLDPVRNAGRVERIRSGFGFLEGPVWVAARGFLLFNDLNSSTMYRFTPPSMVDVFRRNTNRANGLAIDPQGRLVICETNTGRVTRMTLDGQPVVVAMGYQRPNDVIVRSDGTIYFTDILGRSVHRIDPRGRAHLVSNLVAPNGIALSPDEKILYTSHNPRQIFAFSVNPDGSTGQGRKLANIDGNCDGMAIDDAGNIYTTVDTGIQVLRPNGQSLGTIRVPERPANCTFGGADRKTLFITARTSLYRVSMPIPGLP
jgi:gluconolactonase